VAALVAGTLGAAGCAGTALPGGANAPAPSPTPPPKVLIISVDGLRPDALAFGGAAQMMALQSRGTTAAAARTIMPSLTLPSHTSMLSGYAPSVHGVTWNEWDPTRPALVPSIFARARQAGRRTVMVAGKTKFHSFDERGALDVFVQASGNVAVANEAVVQIAAGFDLMFVHLPDVDLTGHGKGWMSPDYLAQVGDADRAVGRILAAIPEGTTVILTADHGGHDNTHGFDQPSDMSIPWVIAGPDVIAGQTLPATTRVSTMDTAATALYVLGLTLPADAGGRPVAAAFRKRTSSAPAVVQPAA
jgi:predicted AlkP superfamily pyrophosphatase or phosphodiesterase